MWLWEFNHSASKSKSGWRAVSVPLHPKGVQWVYSQGHQPWQTMRSWTSPCAHGHLPAGTGSGKCSSVQTNCVLLILGEYKYG